MPERWTDDRLDDRFQAVENRITYVNGLPVKVAELTEKLKAVERELTHEQGAVPRLTAKLEEMTATPRKRWEGVILAAVGAFVGVGGGGVIVAVLTGGVH